MIEHDLEHVVEEALLKLIVSPLALAHEEGLSVNVREGTHLPDCSVRDGNQRLALASCSEMVLEVPKGVGRVLEPTSDEVALNAWLETVDLTLEEDRVVSAPEVLEVEARRPLLLLFGYWRGLWWALGLLLPGTGLLAQLRGVVLDFS